MNGEPDLIGRACEHILPIELLLRFAARFGSYDRET
jgi:hypothetical protein